MPKESRQHRQRLSSTDLQGLRAVRIDEKQKSKGTSERFLAILPVSHLSINRYQDIPSQMEGGFVLETNLETVSTGL